MKKFTAEEIQYHLDMYGVEPGKGWRKVSALTRLGVLVRIVVQGIRTGWQ